MPVSQSHSATRRFAIAFALLGVASGCEALSPQQLWKLNRQPNMDRGDAYFSIPVDPAGDAEPGEVTGELEAPEARVSAAHSPRNSDQG